tara:strand:- start:14683 stop:15786 length:1104 start_codon:yes stop_codon:yes gene_type:complete
MSSTSNIPGNEYFDFQNNGWRSGAAENWSQNHQVNAETGELEGDYPLPPHEVARGYQAMHDRAVWNYRRRLMDQGRSQIADGTNFSKGALGLLQSYRSGGGAALEAGVYNQVASGKRAEGSASFQQAQMTQPLDLLSDLRRHEGVVAQRKADRANERQMVATIIGGVLGGNISTQPASGGQTAASSNYEGGTGAQGGYGNDRGSGGIQAETLGLADPELTGQQGQQQQQTPGQQQSQQSPFAGAVGTSGGTGLEPEAGGFESQTDPFKQQGGDMGGVGGAGQGQQQGAGAGSPMAASFGMPGADGNFSSDSFAAASAASQTSSPMGAMARIDLNHAMADMYESDPFYQSLPIAIHAEWRKRLQGATA